MSCKMTPGAARPSRLALVGTMALMAGSLAAQAATDTSRLPRLAGAKVVFASASSTILTTTEPVQRAYELTTSALINDNWQPYDSPTAARADTPSIRIMSFKKGPDALSLFITVAPAQGNATSVSYTGLVLQNDLPFPKDATTIKFDPDKPHLGFVTTQSVDAMLGYFRSELRQRGWSLWSAKDGARQAGGASGEMTQNGAYAYYVRDDKRPLLLTLQKRADAGLDAEIKAVPAELLVSQIRREQPTEVKQAPPRDPVADEAAARAKQQAAQASKAIDDQISQMAQTILKDALSDVRGGKPQAAPLPRSADSKPLAVLPERSEPIPLPQASEEIEFDGERGNLEFYPEAPVGAVAEFYRNTLKPLGWREKRTPINRDNMVALNFSSGAKELSITVMKMGQRTRVTADGSALQIASPAEKESKTASAESPPATEPVLEAEDRDGLPVPNKHSLVGSTRSLFRYEVNASVPARVDTVLAFYRQELGKREDWKELPQSSSVTPEKVTLAYATANGPATLKLERKSNETVATLAISKQVEAEKAGLLPKLGQVKLLFGNVTGSEATVTINKQAIKIAAGAGAKKPDGPAIELPPGKHRYTLKIGSKQLETETIEIAAGDIWGMIVGPGGALALQMY